MVHVLAGSSALVETSPGAVHIMAFIETGRLR